MAISHAVSYLSRSRAAHGLSKLAIGSHITIFSIHRPLSPLHEGLSPEFLRTALEKLSAAGYHFVSLEDLLLNTSDLPPKSVCLTMDDGYQDQADLLAPILVEFDTKTTFFVITDLVDGLDWPWDEKVAYIMSSTQAKTLSGLEQFGLPSSLSLETPLMRRSLRRMLQQVGKELLATEVATFINALVAATEVELPQQPPEGYRPISWHQARALESQGMHFAPHSCNHHITSRLSMEEAQRQFSHSWQRLTEELTRPSKIYCYPTGRPQDFNGEHEQLLASMGYLGAVSFMSTPLRLKQLHAQRYRLPRIAFPDRMENVFRYASWLEALRSFGK